MSAPISPPAPPRQPPSAGVQAALTVLACVAQAFVLFFTFVMGLGWGGLTYLAAVLQAAIAFGLIARLATGRRRTVLLVPLLSAALTAALAVAGQAHGRATACSDEERAAAGQLAAPPGADISFEGEYIEGCVARARMRLPKQAILEHYRAELARDGWQETPGRHEATVGTAAEKDGLQLVVDINSPEEGGAQTLEVVVGARGSPTPCQINTVDGYLRRTPTSQVEPGTWVMLPSDTGQRGSVVIRDSTGAEVYDFETHPQPQDGEDLMQLEESPGSGLALDLEEGGYQVQCRARHGAASTVPLRVAWGGPAAAEQEHDVVLRIFETPEH